MGGQGEEGVQAEEVVQSAGVSLRAHGPVDFFFFVSRPSLNGAVLPNCAYADISYCLAGVCSSLTMAYRFKKGPECSQWMHSGCTLAHV